MSLLLRAGSLDRGVADLYAGRLRLGRLWDPHLEDALVEVRLDLPGVDTLWQGQRAREVAEGTFDPVVPLALLLVLGLPLTGDRQDVVLDLDVDVVLGQARKIAPEHEVVLGLEQIHRRNPAPGRPVGGATIEEAVEEPVHVALQRVELTNRVPTNKCHDSHLLVACNAAP